MRAMWSKKLLREYGRISERDEHGEHFMTAFAWEPLEKLGLIRIIKPVHEPTGIPYSQEYYHLEHTELGHLIANAIFDGYGELIEDAVCMAKQIIISYQWEKPIPQDRRHPCNNPDPDKLLRQS